MIFADKLTQLRKKAGWSQEELAEQMNVTRQSVSKWEGAQSVPDLEKMIRLSDPPKRGMSAIIQRPAPIMLFLVYTSLYCAFRSATIKAGIYGRSKRLSFCQSYNIKINSIGNFFVYFITYMSIDIRSDQRSFRIWFGR